ncbi:MAG: hypothetical protein ACE5JD_03400 [Candidatus Methylomirabilia bacterium]
MTAEAVGRPTGARDGGTGPSARLTRDARCRCRGGYPQVDPGARGLGHRAVVVCSPDLSVAQALRDLRRHRARLLVVKEGQALAVAWPSDLRRALAFGLGARRVGDVSRWRMPVVDLGTSEVRVRRLLLEGAPVVLIREARGVIRAVEPAAHQRATPPLTLALRLARQVPGPTLELLREVGRLADSLGARAYVVGGLVRDLLRGMPTQDLDVVVEGNGMALARRLARQLGGKLTVHEVFATASIERPAGARVDVATARQERYAAPGALPSVSPASLGEDLARRDFTVNAMALALSASVFGQLLDPFGGRTDLRRRRLRILHPLSFVEDPTRIFRAVRYASRLGFTLERGSRRALALAVSLAPYPRLSGQRISAELELIMAEPEWGKGLHALGRLGALRLLDPAYRFSGKAVRRIHDLQQFLQWGRAHGVSLDPLPLAFLALLGHLTPALAEQSLRRLALRGEPLARLRAALSGGPALARKLEASSAASRSRLASLMRDRPMEALGFAWLVGSEVSRRDIQWFLAEGRQVRPLLSGEDLLVLGMVKGPQMRQLLDRLRDERLDRRASTRQDEVLLVKAVVESRGGTGQLSQEARKSHSGEP